MMVLETEAPHLSLSQKCAALNVSRSTVYSRLRPRSEIKKTSRKQSVQPRALSLDEKKTVLESKRLINPTFQN